MRFFVTGGAGFIGSAFVKAAHADGHSAVTFDIANSQNVGDDLQLELAVDSAKPDWIVHLAAVPGVSNGVDNCGLAGALAVQPHMHNVLKAALRARAGVMLASTGSVYGDQATFPTVETAPMLPQTSFYAASKLACEGMLSAWCKAYDLPGIALRLGTIIGPGNNKGFIRDFVHQLMKDETELSVLGNGLQTKAYLHIDDLTSAMLATVEHDDNAEHSEHFNVYNVGPLYAASIRELIPFICSEMRVKPEITFENQAQGFYGDIPHIDLDNTKLRNTGWAQKHTPETAVRENVRWLLAQRAQKEAA